MIAADDLNGHAGHQGRHCRASRASSCGATRKSLPQINKTYTWAERPRSVRPHAMMQGGKGRILLRAVLPTCPGLQPAGAFSAWDQMKPRTVYEKAVQDFTETARRLARLNQPFRQASFAEFEMLMVDDEVLKRYGLPKPMVERALLEVYQTVVLDQQR